MPKILYFYPDNPLIINQGNNARAHTLLQYFKSRSFSVDFVGESKENFTEKNLEELKQQELISNGFLIRKRKKSGLKYLFGYSIPNKIKNGTSLFNRLGVGQLEDFNTILKNNNYDYIIVSYALFAPFIEDRSLTKSAELIVDTHDFFTAQFKDHKKFKAGKVLETELKLLNKFDTLWSISTEEKFVFTQFLPNKNILTVPHGVQDKSSRTLKEPSIDIFYIGSNNPHNIQSAKWFFSKVYPMLSKDITIKVVGRVCEAVPELPNVSKETFVENIDKLYEQTKITICPMLSGTGLKIKVVESLSYGLPVVCNERGVDGLLSKVNNGCLVSNDPKEFAQYISQLLGDQEFYSQHAREARDFFNASLVEDKVFSNLDVFFKLNP